MLVIYTRTANVQRVQLHVFTTCCLRYSSYAYLGTIDTGTCTYHPFAMVPVRYLAYGPYGGMTPFVVRGKSRGKNSGTNDDFFRIVPRTHKYLHNWTRSYIFVMKSSGSMFHIYFFITVSIWVQSGCDRYRHMGVLECDRYRHLDRIRRHIGYLRSREPISATGGTEIDRYRHLLKYLAAHIGQNRFGLPISAQNPLFYYVRISF